MDRPGLHALDSANSPCPTATPAAFRPCRPTAPNATPPRLPRTDFHYNLDQRGNQQERNPNGDMATGRSNKLVGQTGEYLVAAELSRRGYIATTFTGNVPYYDIIASNENGKHVSVQVKASSGSSWQFADISRYCRISFKGNSQIVGRPERCPVQRLVVVFVVISAKREDRFYILKWNTLRNLLIKHHKTFLKDHGGKRPKKWDSLHCAILENVLTPHLDRWDVVKKCLT